MAEIGMKAANGTLMMGVDADGNAQMMPVSPAVQGATDDAAYTDATGAADGTAISLLKGIYMQLAVIAANTAA